MQCSVNRIVYISINLLTLFPSLVTVRMAKVVDKHDEATWLINQLRNKIIFRQ
jgi:hypothetical protein